MATTLLLPETPFIKVKDETIAINYGGQRHTFSIGNISNVYLKKTKTAIIPSFLNSMLSLENRYKLFIRTNDSQEVKIKVKADQKQHFVNLVFYIRKAKAKLSNVA